MVRASRCSAFIRSAVRIQSYVDAIRMQLCSCVSGKTIQKCVCVWVCVCVCVCVWGGGWWMSPLALPQHEEGPQPIIDPSYQRLRTENLYPTSGTLHGAPVQILAWEICKMITPVLSLSPSLSLPLSLSLFLSFLVLCCQLHTRNNWCALQHPWLGHLMLGLNVKMSDFLTKRLWMSGLPHLTSRTQERCWWFYCALQASLWPSAFHCLRAPV